MLPGLCPATSSVTEPHPSSASPVRHTPAGDHPTELSTASPLPLGCDNVSLTPSQVRGSMSPDSAGLCHPAPPSSSGLCPLPSPQLPPLRGLCSDGPRSRGQTTDNRACTATTPLVTDSTVMASQVLGVRSLGTAKLGSRPRVSEGAIQMPAEPGSHLQARLGRKPLPDSQVVGGTQLPVAVTEGRHCPAASVTVRTAGPLSAGSLHSYWPGTAGHRPHGHREVSLCFLQVLRAGPVVSDGGVCTPGPGSRVCPLPALAWI